MRPETPAKLIARVARRIAQLRQGAGLKHEEFAEALDVSLQYAYRVESGENLTLTTLTRIAAVLKVGVNDLFEMLPASTTPKTGSRKAKKRSAARRR